MQTVFSGQLLFPHKECECNGKGVPMNWSRRWIDLWQVGRLTFPAKTNQTISSYKISTTFGKNNKNIDIVLLSFFEYYNEIWNDNNCLQKLNHFTRNNEKGNCCFVLYFSHLRSNQSFKLVRERKLQHVINLLVLGLSYPLPSLLLLQSHSLCGEKVAWYT